MHGVKRLFSWMIPRFDRERFDVSLVSLRRKDLSEETLEGLGVDITYLERSKFDPRTLPALLDVVDRKQIDVLHLHGYGATTFGRLAAARRRIPAILHEHANLTDTPWFQKVADRLLEPYTDIAIAVSKSTADFVIGARQVPASKVKVVYLGVPLEELPRSGPPPRSPPHDRSSASSRGDLAIGTVTRLHESKGNSYLIEAAARVVRERPAARFFLVGEGPLLPDLQAQATIGFPIASASKAVIGVPSQSDGKTLRSNAESVRATSRWKPAKTKRSPRPSARRLGLEVGSSGPSPTRKNRARRPFADDPRRGVDRYGVALGIVEPGDGADRRTRRLRCQARDAQRRSRRRSARG